MTVTNRSLLFVDDCNWFPRVDEITQLHRDESETEGQLVVMFVSCSCASIIFLWKVTVTSRILAEELQGNLTQTHLVSNKKVILKDVCKTGPTFSATFIYLRRLCLATMSYLSVVR
jgi:hypothetical protein